MGSRLGLWGFLVLGAVPFFLEATTGCDVVFGLDQVRKNNAVSCQCSCDASAPHDVLVVLPEDDAEEVGGSMNIGDGDLDLGVDGFVGLRFESLAILQGSTIAHAYVQFVGDRDGETELTSVLIRAQASTSAASFTTASSDLSSRPVGASEVTWSPGEWNNDAAGLDQRTPDIATLLQPLVSDTNWKDTSSIVLRFEGKGGHRSAESFEGSDRQAELIIELSAAVAARLPVCGSSDLLVDGVLDAAAAVAQCERAATTLSEMAGACGYPQPCSCSVVDLKDPNGEDAADTFPSGICKEGCAAQDVDLPECNTFDPNAFTQCVMDGGSIASCKHFVSATNAPGGSEICVASGSPLAFHAFGERSECQVDGISDIAVDGRSPIHDPATAGRIEVLGEPCPGGSCRVHPFFDLHMDDIEFEVRWHSNPVFGELVASGTGLETAPVDLNGDAVFATDTIFGTGAGQRGSTGLAVDASNPDPLGLRVDWAGRSCLMDGGLEVAVGDDGVCEADNAIECASDDDCAGVGGTCTLPGGTAQMTVGLDLAGELVNQPPSAVAGADQTIECTSTGGAPFRLDGRGSSDPDQNLALASWHAGTRTGPTLGYDLVVRDTLGIGASQQYVLRLVDGFAQTDEDSTNVAVVDSTPPVIACNAPATIRPPDAAIAFGATATDVCDAEVAAQVLGYDCFTFTKKGKSISKLESCVVSFEGNTLSIADVGGYGDVIQWFVGAVDDSGNMQQVTCEVVVKK